MSLRTSSSVIIASALVVLSAAAAAAQTRLKGVVHTPGNNPLVAHEQVRIEGAGQYTTDDHGEFEFDLAGNLKVGQPARFHVDHVNPAIKVQQWIVTMPCYLQNGRAILPAVGSEPILIVVIPREDQQLRSANEVSRRLFECLIEEAASDFKPITRSEGSNRSSFVEGRPSVVADQVPYGPLYESPSTQAIPKLVEAAYRVAAQEKSSVSSSEGVQDSPLLDQAFLTKKAAELGFTPRELADALDAWAHSVEDRYEKGLAALYEGRYREASSYISASIPSPAGEFLKRYVPLARAEYEQGHYSAAEAALRKVLAVHNEDPLTLNNLGVVLDAEAKYAEAEPLYNRALAIAEKALGPDHPSVAICLNNLGLLYYSQGKYAEAEPLYKRALAIHEKALGPDHPEVAIDLNNLAELYRTQGKYAEAESLLKRALTMDEKALGPDHPHVATYLNNLASVYKSQGKYAEAEPLYKRALTIDEKALGPDHPDVASGLNNLAELYRIQGKYSEAEPLYKQALAIVEKALGPDHPHVATGLNNLGLLYYAQGKYTEAEPLVKRALAIDEKALGPDHPRVATDLNNLAGLSYSQGKYAQAEALFQRALAIDEKALGPDHPTVATVAENLAVVLRKLGRDAEAKVYEDQAARIRSRKKQ